MQERFALRFESGDRRGETIGIPAAGLSVGRRPGNSVQVLDASVSGKHAELSVDERGVVLRDTGSTNGTFVGVERITERRLAHGDLVVLGKVRLTFMDAQMGEAPAPSAGLELEGDVGDPSAAGAGEALHTISADKLARSRSRSVVVAVGLLVVAAGGGAAWWFLGRGAAGPSVRRAVVELPGNLVPNGFSFERELTGWNAPEDASARFLVDGAAASSGETGARAALAGGEWASLRSTDVRATPGKALRAVGELGSDGGARAWLGIEFADSTGERQPVHAWSAPAEVGAKFEHRELTALVPPGYDRALAVVLARAASEAGNALADDVGLVAANDAAAAPKVGEFLWIALGEPARAGVLAKIDHPLLTNVRVVADTGGLALLDGAPVAARVQDDGFALDVGRGGPRTLALTVETGVVAQGIATLGTGGLRTHQVEFAREGVDGLLVGAGLELVRLRFSAPVKLSGSPSGSAFRIEAALGDADVSVQVAFQKERGIADDAGRRAREAEKQGKLGETLAAWGELLDRAPFDAQLVKEAESARSRLIQQGLVEVQNARQAAERARFFRLVDLFRQCREVARAIAAKYSGSEVETAAKELVAANDRDLADLERDLDATERARLQAILAALDAQKMPKLAARVRESLARMSGGTK
ncbi:MAG: FHA domain-containing protein [Planctomycetes bacterium]|nr:FHA domain-containing protein [Planctomycetota bacterium]